MIFPNFTRPTPPEIRNFFIEKVRPQLAEMPTVSEDDQETILRCEFSAATLTRLQRNIRITVARNF